MAAIGFHHPLLSNVVTCFASLFFAIMCSTPNFFFFLQLDVYDGKAVGEGMLLIMCQISFTLTMYHPSKTPHQLIKVYQTHQIICGWFEKGGDLDYDSGEMFLIYLYLAV